jgi:formylglycine-generating enzyme required for sulfatase activity
MCYPPIDQIKEGMKLPEGYLQRTGYRLPTEAEWEYACRAGSTTSRYYGGGEELLGHYAWYLRNSSERSWPLGTLKPNDAGLFDSLGNTWDWTQNRYLSYQVGPAGKPAHDHEDLKPVLDEDSRVLRGGTFYHPTSYIRGAFRYNDRSSSRYLAVGLRVARTCR